MAEIGAQMHVEMRAMLSRFFSFLKYFTCHPSGNSRHQSRTDAIRCNQRWCTCHPRPSKVISGNQRSSEAIRGHPRQSEVVHLPSECDGRRAGYFERPSGALFTGTPRAVTVIQRAVTVTHRAVTGTRRHAAALSAPYRQLAAQVVRPDGRHGEDSTITGRHGGRDDGEEYPATDEGVHWKVTICQHAQPIRPIEVENLMRHAIRGAQRCTRVRERGT